MHKQIIYKASEVFQDLLKGAKTAYDTITSTMGPGGGRVMYLEANPTNSFRETKDGATVAKQLGNFENRLECHGVKLLTDASKIMADTIGDGSTTVVLLTYQILEQVHKLITIGEKRSKIEAALDFVSDFVENQIKLIATKFDSNSDYLYQVAKVASGDSEIGQKIANLYRQLGEDAMIVVEESKLSHDDTKIEEGYFFDKGYVSSSFLKPNTREREKGKIELEDVFVLLYDKNVNNINSLLELINEIQQQGNKPFIIIAEDFDEDILKIFTANRQKNLLNCVCIKSPGYGDNSKDMLDDIANVTGADPQFASLGMSIENNKIHHLGKAQKVIITNNTTTILGGQGDRQCIESRIRELVIKLEHLDMSNSYMREKIQERISKLRRGIGKYSVGAKDESFLKEKKDRVEDGVHASKNALKNGIVPGCGSEFLWTFIQLSKYQPSNEVEKIGVEILKNILKSPTKKIVENAGIHEPSVVVEEIINHMQEKNSHRIGYNINTNLKTDINNKTLERDACVTDIFATGIINPAFVSIESTRIATEKAKIFTRSKFFIVDKVDENKQNVHSPMMPPMM